MTENSNRTEQPGKKYTVFFALFYAAVTCADIFSYMNGIYNSSFFASLIAGIAVPFATMLLFIILLMSLGNEAYKGALAVLIPTLFSCACGYLLKDTTAAFNAIFSFLTPTLAATAVFIISKNGGSVSYRCAGAAFVQFIMSAIQTSISVAVTAFSVGTSFGTVVFDSLNGFINEFMTIYMQALASAASMYPGIDPTVYAAGTQQIESMLISTIVLFPALTCAILFFQVFILTKAVDIVARSIGLDHTAAKFNISSVTNIIFHVCAVLLMFSILFESMISAFTMGILSILIFLLPNYLILGTRRIFTKLSRVMSRGASIFLMIFLLFIGFMISPYLLTLIVVFFGTSEYRASKNISVIK